MKKPNAILRALAVAAGVVILGGGALAAENLDLVGSVDNDSSGQAAAEHATKHGDLPSVAAGVIAALTGGSNPSTTVSQRDAEHGNTTASTNASKHDEDADNDTDTDEDTDVDTEVSNGQEVGDTGTAGTKPGWGCGDTNHEHSGPPGRPGATPPPGCTKSHD